jgi:2-C-methyl-D-erythritol 4-phosphate cytidylyltransferase/2-C-methyl-D-erythritol 2,4-cyclodiphosphate synthase
MSAQYWLVMPAAGSGRRFGGHQPKQYMPLAGRRVIERALAPFLGDQRCRGIVVALDARDAVFDTLEVARHPRLTRVTGGARRCDSVRLALESLPAGDEDWVLVHDAARPCLPREDLDRLLAELAHDPVGGLLATPLADTLKRAGEEGRVAETPPRASLWRALTPQMFRAGLLRAALTAAESAGREPTDEAQAVEWLGLKPRLVAGHPGNLKITTVADLPAAAALVNGGSQMNLRIGSGFDVHAFGPGDHVMLGGVRIPAKHGVLAHSDGDVLLHALTDALLGAAGLGDIGQHFPDSDPRWKGADSTRFVRHAVQLLAERGWSVVNADLTLVTESPRIAAYRDAIRSGTAAALGVDVAAVNLKATTTEKLGFLGRGEGLAAQAVVLVAAV